jgi:hypothetical protein
MAPAVPSENATGMPRNRNSTIKITIEAPSMAVTPPKRSDY